MNGAEASEDTEKHVQDVLNSVKKLLLKLYEKCSDKDFCVDKKAFSQAIDELIESMPEDVDTIMEFLLKHVLPALSVYFKPTAFALVKVFLRESFESILKNRRVKALDFAKRLDTIVLQESVVNKTSKNVVAKTSCQEVTKVAPAEVMKTAAKAGCTAAGLSAVVGGVFLNRDLKDLDKKKKEGSLSEEEYKEQKVERIGEFAGDVIGSGVVATALSMAALSGPVGWIGIGAGAIVSYGMGKLGGQIAKALV